MKILRFLMIAGVVIAATGFGVLVVSGYEVMSLEVWRLAIQSLFQEPMGMFREAIHGYPRTLFGGILVCILAGVTVIASLFAMIVVRLFSGHQGMSSERTVPKSEAKSDRAPKRGLEVGTRRWAMPGWRRSKTEGRAFKDAIADLEEDHDERRGQTLFSRIVESIWSDRDVSEKPGVDTEIMSDFVREVDDWFDKVKSAEANDEALIEAAKDIVDRATPALEECVVARDPEDGDFKIRMLHAWSRKGGADRGEEMDDSMPASIVRTEDQSIFAEAIEEVSKAGVSSSDGQDELETSLGDDVDEEIIDDVGVGIEDKVDELTNDVENEEITAGEDENAVGPDPEELKGIQELKSVEKAKMVRNFLNQVEAVNSGLLEWEEDLSDPEVRRQYIEEMIEALRQEVDREWDDINVLSPLDMGDDEETIEWIKENAEQLDDMRRDLISSITTDMNSDADDDDLNDLYSAKGGQRDDSQDDDPELIEGSEIDQDALGKNAAIEEMPDAPSEPKDMTIGELEEFEKSGELIYQWGHAMRSAGAAEARLCHAVMAKDGIRRRVVGIVHLVAKWRNEEKDESRRINLLLRYVPEGEWFLDEEAQVPRLVNLEGDYVEVAHELMEQPEIEDALLIVQFHGPGAPENLDEQKYGCLLRSTPLSAEEIADKVT